MTKADLDNVWKPLTMKWQGQNFGLLDLCHQNVDLYDRLVGAYNALPG